MFYGLMLSIFQEWLSCFLQFGYPYSSYRFPSPPFHARALNHLFYTGSWWLNVMVSMLAELTLYLLEGQLSLTYTSATKKRQQDQPTRFEMSPPLLTLISPTSLTTGIIEKLSSKNSHGDSLEKHFSPC